MSDATPTTAAVRESAPLAPVNLPGSVKLYVGAVCALAAGSLLWTISRAERQGAEHLWLALAFLAAGVVGTLAPLLLARKMHVYLTGAVLIAVVLVLDPWLACLVAGGWRLIADLYRYRRSTFREAEVWFNSSLVVVETAVGAGLIGLLGWQTAAPDFRLPFAALVTLALGAAMWIVDRLLLSGVIALQLGSPYADVLYDNTLGTQRAEMLADVADGGMGLLAAIIAVEMPWALALLALPVAAAYLALRQHVEVRHRIETSLASAQHIAQLGSWDWDLRSGDQRWSPELFRILGLDPKTDLASPETYLRRVHPDYRVAVAAAFGLAATGNSYVVDHRVLLPDGAERFLDARGEAVRDGHGRPLRVVGTVHDITERKELEEQLNFQAFHDPLTQLPNRAHFLYRLDETISSSGRRLPDIAVLFLDLDRFKLINDTFGHEAGDELLIGVAERLRTCTRPGDVIARLGGGEFTILLLGVADDAAERAAARIIEEITAPITLLDTREIFVSTSIGIVRPSPDQTSGADLLRDADNALYRAKERGRNRYVVFDAGMGEETKERLALEVDLRRALERDELRLLYQPKLDLRTGRAVAVEAFLRWRHPGRGWVAPSVFIPIAEETGLMAPIGRWVMRTALAEAVRWPAHGGAPPILSVNLSAKQVHDPDLTRSLRTLLAEAGLPSDRLRLEIAEGVAMRNAAATIETLNRLREIGVRVVIDDFGTGYSSLSWLQSFPVDALQLDVSFVADLGRRPEAATIAHAVIGLAHGLGLSVVAEGVEREEQVTQLVALGCEHAQGNWFAPPMTSAALAAYLAGPPPPTLDASSHESTGGAVQLSAGMEGMPSA